MSASTADLGPAARPRLTSRARLQYDAVRDKRVLLFPEGLLVLNDTAAAVLGLCDGEHSVTDIVTELGTRYNRPVEEDVLSFLNRLTSKRLIEASPA
jgi:pyrroloquinoline quinone biosynthesis protein D